MASRFECPHCKAAYEVADDLAGKTIMCRLCQKRGQVRSLATPGAAVAATSSDPSRRKFGMIVVGGLASLGAIAAGALLARVPWGKLRSPSPAPPESSTQRRGRRRRGTDQARPAKNPKPGG